MVSFNTQQLARATLISAALFQSATAVANITEDSYFYGQSPPVYPSPPQPGSASWATAYAKAVALVSQMTLEEKANITVGYTPMTGCSGETGSVPRLNWPGVCLSDAGNGLRATDFVNGWPSGVHVGAAWNRNLAYQRALHMGGEFKKKGVNVALGPVVGPLGRVAEGGRNWEGISNDPYLCGALAAESVSGIQTAGVMTSVKHYIGNEQETNRVPDGDVAAVSSNIDDKTLHELYLWPFTDAVHAGTGSIMCSYNRINNSYACQNSKTLNGILKTELGFEGFVVSDWGAQHTGLDSALAGLDVVMPESTYWGVNGGNLTIAVNNGSLTEARVTDMATRLISAWYQMGQDVDFPEKGIGMALDYSTPHTPIYARDPSSQTVLLNGALEGHVLVKNTNSALPLKSPKLLSIFGYDAVAPNKMDVPSPSDVIATWTFGFESLLTYVPFISTTAPPQIAINGTIISGGGSGANAPAYISAPFDAIKEQAYLDGTSLFWDFYDNDPAIDTSSDACLVFINAFATEGSDRIGLHDDYSDALIQNVAANCSNTIVTIHNAGVRLVDQWIDHPNITAVIFAHLPGQDSGRALVQLLYGYQSFSGKLPYTVAKNESDYVNAGEPILPEGEFQLFPQDNFTEGVYIDYRGFDQKNVTPRYEFGFGLTYTTFEYSELTIEKLAGVSTSYLPPPADVIEGGIASLWDVVAQVTATITNTGSVDAAEIAQLYVGIPGGPVRQLRGFSKVDIPVGSNVTVEFDLLRRDLSEWGVTEQSWVLQSGSYPIYVGASSRDLPLVGTLTI
ncbi:putative beta-glucosidase M [Mollisia scopiformis]|uniref:beta-glucosidase n=1 Tax=Mollisia scopiformis TaxID=149040 RepID=A0A194XTK0_MOLSC|nr:putative beta-glucosidase M [Mollisia scopiformis]KUJ23645.1 putative beta-glucosidase M [Mollisia scopiformis]